MLPRLAMPLAMWLGAACCLAASPAAMPTIYETQGRCFGYFHVTRDYFDFYNLYLDCPKVPILRRESIDEQRDWGGMGLQQVHTQLLTLARKPTPACPFSVVAISQSTSLDPAVAAVQAYKTRGNLDAERAGKVVADSLSCTGTALDAGAVPALVGTRPPHGRSKAAQRALMKELKHRAARSAATSAPASQARIESP